MDLIQLHGKLTQNDIWYSEPDVGTVIAISDIEVPESLESGMFYEARVSITPIKWGEFSFVTDLSVEPARTNAIGVKRPRVFSLSSPAVMTAHSLDKAEIHLAIDLHGKGESVENFRFKEALKSKSREYE